MLEWLREDEKRIFLTFSITEADRLKNENPDLTMRIFYWEYWLKNHQYFRDMKEVGIDNAEYILQNYLRHPIGRISLSEFSEIIKK